MLINLISVVVAVVDMREDSKIRQLGAIIAGTLEILVIKDSAIPNTEDKIMINLIYLPEL